MAEHRQMSWIYQARRVATQANAAGGAVVVDISLASGQIARIISIRGLNSGNNGISCLIVDEDNATHAQLASISAAGGANFNLPAAVLAGAATTSSMAQSSGFILASGQKLTIMQSAAGAQNDTMTICITLELFNLPTVPTWSKDRSTNAADVTLAASTISAANTLTAGRIWT